MLALSCSGTPSSSPLSIEAALETQAIIQKLCGTCQAEQRLNAETRYVVRWVSTSSGGLHEAGAGLASAAGLAGVAAAVLQAAGADPEVASDVAQLVAEGHGLCQVARIFAGRGAVGIGAVGARIAHGRLLLWRAWERGL